MERFGVFRAEDPQVSLWLQKHGFEKRRSESRVLETRAKTTQHIQKEAQPASAQTKEVRFYAESKMHSNISTLVAVKQTVPEQGQQKRTDKVEHQSSDRLSNLEMPAITSKKAQRFVHQESEQSLLAGNISERTKIRSYSCPSDNRPTLSQRRFSSVSLLSDRPCNIPVLIRNNDVRLRKYSCPEYYSTSHMTNYYNEPQTRSRELNTNRLGKRTIVTELNNTFQQLPNKHRSKTTREHIETEINNISGVKIELSKNSTLLSNKELQDFCKVPANDYNGNETSKPLSNSTSDDDRFGFVFYEESLESYSLEALPKKQTKQNLSSSMYNSRGNMLTWLGEVNRNLYP